MENREYRIGDVAKMVGLSRDALRFYEKKGVITANKRDNGYRYYSENDIYKLMYILYHRKMNTSLDEIESMVGQGTDCSRLRERTRQRIAEEKEKMRRHQQAVTRLKLVERDLAAIESNLNACRVKRFPAGYIMGTCGSLQDGLKEWFRLSSGGEGLDMTYFYNVLSYKPEEGLVQEGTKLVLYRGIEPYLDTEIDTRRYPPTDEVECVYRVMESPEPIPGEEAYRYMVQWANRRGLKAGRTLYANDMISFFRNNKITYCLELYLPLVESGENAAAD